MTKLSENFRNPEADFHSPSGGRRDSARRLSLRSTGLSIRRGLSPRWSSQAGFVEPGGVSGCNKEDRMITMTMLFLAIGTLSCCTQVVHRETVVAKRLQAGASMPRV